MSFTYRKTWKCGERWVEGELTIDSDKGCGQDIYQSNDKKFESGKYMILNMRDGVGGPRHTVHECPKRVGSKTHVQKINMREYDWHQQNYPCSVCGTIFNKEVYPLCPTCMKLECRKCGNLQHWVVGKGLDCFLCGERCDPRSVRYMGVLE